MNGTGPFFLLIAHYILQTEKDSAIAINQSIRTHTLACKRIREDSFAIPGTGTAGGRGVLVYCRFRGSPSF
jgi:hypothetical protein